MAANSNITRIMSQSLEQFDCNPRGYYSLTRGNSGGPGSWGLPPGAQLYRAAKMAIDHGASYNTHARSSRNKHKTYGSRGNGTSVPPINPRGGLVGQDSYTTYKSQASPKGPKPKDRYSVLKSQGARQSRSNREGQNSGTHSLPLEATERTSGGRKIGSAPGNKKDASARPAEAPANPPAKINTLVNGGGASNDEATPRDPAGSKANHGPPRQEKVSDANKSVREWEMVRAEPKTKKQDTSFHAKKNSENADIPPEQLVANGDSSKNSDTMMGGMTSEKRPKSQAETDKERRLRQALQKRREEFQEKKKAELSMQRKNTTFYSTMDGDRTLPTRRERTRAQFARKKTELVTKAKTKDNIREKRVRNFVALVNPNQKDNIDLELYKIEEQMHIYLQSAGLDVSASEFNKLRPLSRNTTQTGNMSTRSDTTLKRKSAKSKKSSLPPWHRKVYVLNKREAEMYHHLNKVYRNDELRDRREEAFLKKVKALQVEEWKRLWNEYDHKLRERETRRILMQRQLEGVRQKYADDRWERIARFPVNRIAVHDENDRHEYGLPGELDETYDQYAPKTVAQRKPKEVFDSEEIGVRNKRRYDPIFDVYRKMNGRKRRPKMEGIDVFTIEDDVKNGTGKKRRVGVKALLHDAENLLEQDDSDDSQWEDDEDKGTSRRDASNRGPAANRSFTKPQQKQTAPHSNNASLSTSLNRSGVGKGARPGVGGKGSGSETLITKYGAYSSQIRNSNAPDGQTHSGRETVRRGGPVAQAKRLEESALAKNTSGNYGGGASRYRPNVSDFRASGANPNQSADKSSARNKGAASSKDGTGVNRGGEDEATSPDQTNAHIVSSVPMNTPFPGKQVNSKSDFGYYNETQPIGSTHQQTTESFASQMDKKATTTMGQGGSTQNVGDEGTGKFSDQDAQTSSKVQQAKSDSRGEHNIQSKPDGQASNKQHTDKPDNERGSKVSLNAAQSRSDKTSHDSKEAPNASSSQDLASSSKDNNKTATDKAQGPNQSTDGSDNKDSSAATHIQGQPSGKETDTSSQPKTGNEPISASAVTTTTVTTTTKKKTVTKSSSSDLNKEGDGAKPGDSVKDNDKSSKANTKTTTEQIQGSSKSVNDTQPLVNDHVDSSENINNFSGSSDKENKKPKQTKTVRILSPEKSPKPREERMTEQEFSKETSRVKGKAPTRPQSPGVGKNQSGYTAPKPFEVKKSEQKTTRAQSPNLFQKGKYKEPEKFEIKKSERKTTKAQGPNLGQGGDYTAPEAYTVSKSTKATTKANGPTLGVGEYTAPDAYEITKTSKSTRAVSPSFGKGDYKAPEPYELRKSERNYTRARSPVFRHRKAGDYSVPEETFEKPTPKQRTVYKDRQYNFSRPDSRQIEKGQPAGANSKRKTRTETTTTTKTIRRKVTTNDEDSEDEDLGAPGKSRTPPKRERAPPRRTKTTLQQQQEKSQDPQRPDIPTPDLATDTEDEEDDIFEKAKRKYGIVLDDSD